ncbi:TIGR03936 family radical SAM-associated protein [Anaerotalea alkaliphila]|uniref:DUF2344 domain-containing protein n=1 Tax=Anaerotalea alkaliphila TaxID=2662126 RepID=A0A7X5HWS1_9FIRM|nr:TIGR03936 family radical SAM-associated protein [Anaerotalea alkaliphila]NDL67916.1 DUF2344 domain-containing protein [Anaerotalea alkaliphila]
MKARLKFTKTGPIRFVGHLDFMRTLQKLFRRAGIPVAYSEGFSPHQNFSIAAPLPVGTTSEGDYLDMQLTHAFDKGELASLLAKANQAAPPGVRFLTARILEEGETAGMAAVAASSYVVELQDSLVDAGILQAFMDQEQILVLKINKKGKSKEQDLRPGILAFDLEDGKLHMTLATGSVFNIKPETVLSLLLEFAGTPAGQDVHYRVHRTELYRQADGKLVPL